MKMNKRQMGIGGLVLGLIALGGCNKNNMDASNKSANISQEVDVIVPNECKQVINAGFFYNDNSTDTDKYTGLCEYITGRDSEGNIKTYVHNLHSDKWLVRTYKQKTIEKITLAPITTAQK